MAAPSLAKDTRNRSKPVRAESDRLLKNSAFRRLLKKAQVQGGARSAD
jgi:dGTP triphosphohydrolase